ncbi:MAG: tetratricopeptide repeat protein, partial [Anaerolineae bacterium]
MPKQKIVADNPESITELEQILEKTYALNDVDKLEDALTHCQQAINLHPKSAEAHNLKGLILDRLGEKQEALAAFQKAVHLDPEFQDAQQNLADVQAEVHDTQTKNLKLNGARHVAKWGAFSFGLALTVNEIISSVFGMVNTTLPVIFQSPFLALTIYSLIFAVFIGAAIAVLGLEAYNEPRRFGILGIISSSIVYFITGTFIHFYSVFSS